MQTPDRPRHLYLHRGVVQFQPTGRGSGKAGFVLGWYGGLGGADQGSWEGAGTQAPSVTHVQSHNTRAGGGKSPSALRGAMRPCLPIPCSRPGAMLCVSKGVVASLLPPGARGKKGWVSCLTHPNGQSWLKEGRVGEGSRAVRNKVSEKRTRVRGGGQGWGPQAASGKKGSSGRRAGWAQSQALTRPLSHPQPPQTPDMEAARPVWPGCREQQPKPRGSGLHFLPCPGGVTGGPDSTRG